MGTATSTEITHVEQADLIAAANYTERDLKKLYKKFQALDKNSNGELDPQELIDVPEIADNPLVKRVMSVFDTNSDGKLSFVEFVVGLARLAAGTDASQKTKFAFDIYDLNKDGYISNGELFTVMKMMVGSNLTDAQLQQLVDRTIIQADKDGDGMISFIEFNEDGVHIVGPGQSRSKDFRFEDVRTYLSDEEREKILLELENLELMRTGKLESDGLTWVDIRLNIAGNYVSLSDNDQAISVLQKAIEDIGKADKTCLPKGGTGITGIPAKNMSLLFKTFSKKFTKKLVSALLETYDSPSVEEGFHFSPCIGSTHEPDTYKLEHLLGAIYFECLEYKLAQQHFLRAFLASPTHVELLSDLALVFMQKGEVEDALMVLYEAVDKGCEKNEKVLCLLSTVTLGKLMDENANVDTENASPKQQGTGEKHLDREYICKVTNRCDKLMTAYLEKEPNSQQVALRLAEVAFFRQEFDRAEGIFENLLEKAKENDHRSRILTHLGQVKMSQQKYLEAESLFRDALDKDKHNSNVYPHLIQLSLMGQTPKKKEAFELFKACVYHCPDDVEVHGACGMNLLDSGMEKQVLNFYSQYVKENPNSKAAEVFKKALGSPDPFILSTRRMKLLFVPLILVVLVTVYVLKSFWDQNKETIESEFYSSKSDDF